MHKRFVLSVISRIFIIGCLSMLLPLGWAVHDNPHSAETSAFLITILLGLAFSLSLLGLFRIGKEDYKKVNTKDGLAIVGLSWVGLSLLGAFPVFLSLHTISFTDAFFEVASGFTTTGATIFPDVESLPRGVLFWRSLTHWLGGMGIIVLYIALLPAIGNNAFQLYKAEAPGLTTERVEPQIKETAKKLWGVYFLFTFLETAILMMEGMPLFDALCHTFGTVATGGFSTKNASIGAYGPPIQWVIFIFMILAGTNFILHYQFLKGRLSAYIKNEEFRAYFLFILFLLPVFCFVLTMFHPGPWTVRDVAFQIVSILTTTGYTTVDFDLWPNILRFSLVLLMFVGGCGGSTGGGIKVIRVLLSIKIAVRSVVQAVFPNAVLPIKFNGRPIGDRLVLAVLSYFVLFFLLFFSGTVLLLMTDNCDLLTALTASISALSNIGPGLNGVGATQNYAWVSIPGKWTLTFLMLAGRLELYSMLILLIPDTWKK